MRTRRELEMLMENCMSNLKLGLSKIKEFNEYAAEYKKMTGRDYLEVRERRKNEL